MAPRREPSDDEYKEYDTGDDVEQQALLPRDRRTSRHSLDHPEVDADAHVDAEATPPSPTNSASKGTAWCFSSRFGGLHLLASFLVGVLACSIAQYYLCAHSCFGPSSFRPSYDTNHSQDYDYDYDDAAGAVNTQAAPEAGSTESHAFPPPSPTNYFPSLFPTNVGYSGITPTGAEPALVATAPSYPQHTIAPNLISPTLKSGGGKDEGSGGDFDLVKHWGNLSPWYSVGKGTFGVDSGPETPQTCRVTGLHFLHRHGARYPTSYASYGGPASFSSRLHAAADQWVAKGDLSFLNDWTYKLGEEVLTPFGRQQLFDLGVSMRMKYGFLLKNFTESNTIPVFRTESQDRMLSSALNFAIGFFGYPMNGAYEQSITIEADGFNNTLAPYKTCPNARAASKSDRGKYYVQEWASIYLADALKRLQSQLDGFELTIEDVYVLQQLCAYETVAIGYSKFCELFTQEEWEGFDYALDLYFWYDSAFGSPVARVQGVGYVQELVARLTATPIQSHNSSTNATLDDDIRTFPLGQSLYVDATHEVVVLNIITALNLTTFARDGPLPADRIPEDRAFKVSRLAPFATNVQFQLLSCTSRSSPQIRIIINDGTVPLTGIKGCPEDEQGMCPVETFVEAMKEVIGEVDWEWGCFGDWDVEEGERWETVTGDPPKKQDVRRSES